MRVDTCIDLGEFSPKTLTDVPGLPRNASGALGHIGEACEQGMPWAGSPASWSLGPNLGLLGSSLPFWGRFKTGFFCITALAVLELNCLQFF